MAKNINNSEKIQNTVEDNGLSFTELIDQILNPSHDQNSEPQVKNEAIAVEDTALNLSQCDFCGISFSSSEILKNHVYVDHQLKSVPPVQYFEAQRHTIHDDFKNSFYIGKYYAQWVKSRKKENLGKVPAHCLPQRPI